MSFLSLKVSKLKDAQIRNRKRIEALDGRGQLGRSTKKGTLTLASKMRQIVHVDTGTLRASVRVDFRASKSSATGVVFLDASARNPRGGRPAEYGIYENARGGSHAFIQRTLDAAPAVEAVAINEIVKIVVGDAV